MSNILCSKAYQEFFLKLPDNDISLSDLFQHINRTIAPVANDLSIARLDLSFQAPKTFYDKEGKNIHETVYESGPYENAPFSAEYITGDNGQVCITAYPMKGITWSISEEEDINFFLKNLYYITGRTRVMELMAYTAIADQMTRLPNAGGLERYCNKLISLGMFANYTGLFINLKNFKYINQRLGGQVGNMVLCEYAETVNKLIQPKDYYARLGGDNFLALIANEHLQDFIKATASITIKIPLGATTMTFDITTNTGMYAIQPTDTMHDMMNKTSLAMVAAKASLTEDFVWYHPSMYQQMIRRKEISNTFSQALANREFIVYYQPKVYLDNNTLCGAEALVRWVKNGSIVPPMEFIPVLEQDGTICMLDFYMLDTVCKDLRRWLDAGIEPVRTSVNFSKLHLHNRQLAEDVLKIVNKYKLDSKYIEIEITETSGYEDFDTLNNFVNTMKKHGIRISLDDFGTGYSSLNLLKDLNVDIIKLDRSFLINIENQDIADKIIVETIVHMVKELNMQVVAEGVETSGQASYLRSIQCHIAQGYLFDKPLSHDDFTKCLTGERLYNPSL